MFILCHCLLNHFRFKKESRNLERRNGIKRDESECYKDKVKGKLERLVGKGKFCAFCSIGVDINSILSQCCKFWVPGC